MKKHQKKTPYLLKNYLQVFSQVKDRLKCTIVDALSFLPKDGEEAH